MQLLKEKILFKPQTSQNVQIFIPQNDSFNGLQEDINDFVAQETGLSINDVEDKETFRYLPENDITIKVRFYSGNTYDDIYEFAGFTTEEISTRNEVILRSFYIMQVYDSVSPENQTLLHTGYFNGFNFIVDNPDNTTYTLRIEEEYEFANLYIPQWFIKSLPSGTTDIYGKMSFYNAKTGELQLFSHASQGFPSSYKQPTTDADIYFTLELDPTNLTYDVNQIYAWEMQNADYNKKMNKTLDSFDNEKPTYPTGNTFINRGEYIET